MRLELRSLSKSFPGHGMALREISAEFGECGSLALIGPSGGGKSTLLRILAGLERPDAGDVTFDGQRVPFEDERSLRQHRCRLGVVFQAFNLFPHLTAAENVLLPLVRVHGLGVDEARERATRSLARLGLDAHAQKRPSQLSGGQKQRVAIARAIAIRPRLLLFDEPTSALDPEMTAEVLDAIGELKAEGRDFILVTHQMAFARKVADRVAFLANGQIVEQAPAEELFSSPKSAECRGFLDRVLKY